MKTLYSTLLLLLFIPCFIQEQPLARLSNDQFKEQFLTAINAQRAKGCKCGGKYMPSAGPLVWNAALALAAREHAADMYRNQYFDHESLDGRSLEDRLLKVGYTYKGYRHYAVAENIAMGQQSIDEVLNGWFASPGHCINLMNREYNEIGIAETHTYWVQDFGGRVSFASR